MAISPDISNIQSPPPQYTTHADEHREHKATVDVENVHSADITFAKAAFAFRDGLDRARERKSSQPSVTFDSAPTVIERHADNPGGLGQELDNQAHQDRHKRRIRIARCVQHMLTSGLSLGVAIFQGKTYITYQQTKDVAGAWPTHPNLLPTVMLFATGIGAFVIDLSALIAYLWPQNPIGHKAYSLAVSAHYVITTIKGIAYSFSTIVCRNGFDLGNSSGSNNDLWSWTCSSKADRMAHINDCHANCTGSLIAWIFAIVNIGIEVLGLILDQFVARDNRRWADKSGAGAASEIKPASTIETDKKALLAGAAPIGTAKQSRYTKLAGNEYEALDRIQDDLEEQLKDSLPEMKVSNAENN